MSDAGGTSRDSSKQQADVDTQLHQPDPAELQPFRQAQSLEAGHPSRLGRFEITKVVGRGAFGIVYGARDPQLDREVAIKVPHIGTLTSIESRERFRREARAAATLRHPNICPVYEIGESDGQHYIVMAYISGQSLEAVIKNCARYTDRQVALVVRKLAQALAAAHEKKIVHRDLKPANVMIDKERREPVIMDFGLARYEQADDSNLTQTGQIMGTPAYMPPEQARGAADAIGPVSDVYSLGVMFYELLCGQRPFNGSVAEVFAKILGDKPRRPSALRPDVDPHLEAICLKAMAKSIDDRYKSMKELAGELSKYLKRDVVGSDSTSTGELDETIAPPPLIRTAEIVEESAETRIAGNRTRTFSRWLAAVGAIAALILIVGVILFTLPENAAVNEARINLNNVKEAGPIDANEWHSLFNGRDLTDWQQFWLQNGKLQDRADDHWTAEEGTIKCTTSTTGFILAPEDPPGLFPGLYRDFSLELDVKVPAKQRATVVVRVEFAHDEPKFVAIPILDYYALSIAEQEELKRIPGMIELVLFVTRAAQPSGEWNRLRIDCEEDRIAMWLNETPLDDEIKRGEFFRDAPSSGYIGFGNLGGTSKEVSFKNIRIRRLN